MKENTRKTRWVPFLTVAALAAIAFSPPGWVQAGVDPFPSITGTAHILGSEAGGFAWDKIFDANGQVVAASGVSQAVFIKDDVSVGKNIDLTALAEGNNNLVRNAVVDRDQDIGNAYVALAPDSEGNMLILGGIERTWRRKRFYDV